jgi:hypothetical protein
MAPKLRLVHRLSGESGLRGGKAGVGFRQRQRWGSLRGGALLLQEGNRAPQSGGAELGCRPGSYSWALSS